MTSLLKTSSVLKGIGLVFLFCAWLGCKNSSSNSTQPKLYALATTGMLADAVRQLLPAEIETQSLMGPGVDPHLYKVSHGDVDKLQGAKVIFYNGLHLEGKMADILAQYSREKPCIPVAERINQKLIRKIGEDSQVSDPHIWFDVNLWRQAVKEVSLSLIENFPEVEAQISKNFKEYDQELRDLDIWVAEQLKTVPEERRVIVTAHDAFGYFGQRYKIEVLGLQGISTTAEFGLYDIKRLVDILIARQIKAVFVETSVSPKFIMALKEGAAARGHQVTLGGELYSDALGGADSKADTYVGMVRHNVNTIVRALK
jgi:manganese/zinc/iron transport system substrate-binding protein